MRIKKIIIRIERSTGRATVVVVNEYINNPNYNIRREFINKEFAYKFINKMGKYTHKTSMEA